ncbi:MAG: type III-B CRISPR module RAMP protein Cmr4, partial [Desulfurococcaceae archaeon]
AYATSTSLLNMFNKYIEVLSSINKRHKLNQLNLSMLSGDKAMVSKKELIHNGNVMINEVEVEAECSENNLENIGLANVLPQEIKDIVKNRGLIILPDRENIDLHIINKSIIIQYRVRLRKEEKVVEEGGLWNEEYTPMESVFASLILCREFRYNDVTKEASEVCEGIASRLNDRKFIYVGGKESIGKGLVKLYI